MTMLTGPVRTNESYSVDIHGLSVAGLEAAAVIDFILNESRDGRGGWVMPTNVDVLRRVTRDEEFGALARTARVIIADGMPLVWASALQGQRLPGRIPGSTLMCTLTEEAARRGRSVFFLGGAPGVADRCGELLAERAPGLVVAGTHCPPLGFENDPVEMAAIVDVLRRTEPDVVFVGLGCPKQERLISVLEPEFPETWFFCAGASLAFVAGEVSRAPEWMQSSGLEWVHRLGSEPRRLFKRYVVEDIPFAVRLMSRAGARRVSKRARATMVA
jgi:N-acetylglucosaminyldiphosphoundecaprenol N-acetyl-beta-D-mannosaminyltransferase